MYVKNIYFSNLKLFDEGVLKKERCPQNIFLWIEYFMLG